MEGKTHAGSYDNTNVSSGERVWTRLSLQIAHWDENTRSKRKTRGGYNQARDVGKKFDYRRGGGDHQDADTEENKSSRSRVEKTHD